MKIKKIVEQSDTRGGKIFDLFSQLLILISLISFSIETLPSLSDKLLSVLRIVEIVTVILFTVEYFLRLFVADRKIRFFFSFYGLVDLIAILPFYIACGVDLRSIRIVRLFRLFRIFKVLRYNDAIQKFRMAFLSIKEELLFHRKVKYLNNLIESDHGKLKRLIKPTLGFNSMKTAFATIKGFEVMRMFKKGQFDIWKGDQGLTGEIRLIER